MGTSSSTSNEETEPKLDPKAGGHGDTSSTTEEVQTKEVEGAMIMDKNSKRSSSSSESGDDHEAGDPNLMTPIDNDQQMVRDADQKRPETDSDGAKDGRTRLQGECKNKKNEPKECENKGKIVELFGGHHHSCSTIPRSGTSKEDYEDTHQFCESCANRFSCQAADCGGTGGMKDYPPNALYSGKQ